MADELGADLPVTRLCAEIERELVAAGHADDDISAVARSIRARSGLPG
jgi:3-hydroxyisobutyrate dehydrogenase-like beta-hydroxyacid dehydrogenase